MDVLIVGAGPVGLTMACELAERGVAVRIVEKNSQPTDKSKALVVWPRTLELMHKLGYVEDFLAAGTRLHGASIFSEKSTSQERVKLAHISFDEIQSPYPFGLGIPQSETERILNERLTALGVRVERQVELTGLTQDKNAVSVKLKPAEGDEETLTVPWVVGCDGAHSVCRHALGIKLDGETVPQEFAMMDGDLSPYDGGEEVQAHFHSRGVVAIFPIKPPRFRVIALRPELTSGPEPTPATLEEMQQIFGTRGLKDIGLSNPRWLAAFRVNERRAQSYRSGGVFLAGDAANIHSPVGGQGMNTGMQDAANLAWKLTMVVKGQAPPEPLLGSYAEERERIGTLVVGQTGLARQVVTLRHPVAQAIRNQVFSFLVNQEPIQQRLRNNAAELSVHYPKSPLNRDLVEGHNAWWPGPGPAPGDRLPDGEVVDAQGKASTLFELTHEPKFHLLLLAGPEAEVASLNEIKSWTENSVAELISCHLLADDGSLRHLLGVRKNTLYLIRPDGYVALRSQPASLSALREYLASLGLGVPTAAGGV